ncbi:peptidyl-tRNA hydrolase II [Rhizoclosmatium globosum]|uniref:peptidyl-tRNA hydrolase n=1 Tax=Rhizoclosmatium globosum TaxID=329046 RepID=A0A1Y2CX48_9FUNG|nr:peptidyl-tRNA hydrolase II [Rhizoclosmatium globosum]|eukprot:ORY50915.1 peptidyl-tRNA hydrolase II [Rhizoclosmatium globosum]
MGCWFWKQKLISKRMPITQSEAIDALVPLGFSESQVKVAWEQTGGASVEEVANFLVLTIQYSSEELNAPYKMVLVVNSALGMSTGKIAAQCSHATLGAVLAAGGPENNNVQRWLQQGEPIIVVQSGKLTLKDLEAKSLAEGLPAYLVRDAGRTEVTPGSITVLAVGPAPNTRIDIVTRSLALL